MNLTLPSKSATPPQPQPAWRRRCPRALALLSIALLCPGLSQAGIIFLSDFETGGFSGASDNHDGWQVTALPREAVVQSAGVDPVTSTEVPIRAGRYSARLHIDYSKDYSSINGSGDDKPRNNLNKYPLRFDYGKDYWVAWSVYIPTDWEDDYDKNHDTLLQVQPYKGGPPAITFRIEGDKWILINRWDAKNTNFDDDDTTVRELYNKPTASDKGKWVDWAMRFNFCHQAGCKGKFQVWKNQQQVVNFSGPNAYKMNSANKGPLLQLNIYKSAWKRKSTRVTGTRTVYFDEVRVGDAQSSLAEVSPISVPAPMAPTNLEINTN